MSANSDIIDLDALVPEQVTVKFGNKEIKINPPKTEDILRLGFLGQKLQKADTLPDEELRKAIDDLTAQIYICVPELEHAPLNTAQLLKLSQIIGDMAVPPDARELKANGIEVADPKA